MKFKTGVPDFLEIQNSAWPSSWSFRDPGNLTAASPAFSRGWEGGWRLHVGGSDRPCVGIRHLRLHVTGQHLAYGYDNFPERLEDIV